VAPVQSRSNNKASSGAKEIETTNDTTIIIALKLGSAINRFEEE